MRQVYVIGDSISIQYGPYLERSLCGKIAYSRKEGEADALENLDQPMGANGGDSAMVLDFLQTKLKQASFVADILVVNCGLHDIKTDPETNQRQIPIDQYDENLNAIFEISSDAFNEVIWVRTTPAVAAVHNTPEKPFHRFEEDVQAYNQVADHLVTEYSLRSIDLFSFTEPLIPDAFCDHVHFKESVRQIQGAFIAGHLLAWYC